MNMSGTELVRIARRLYGGHGWQTKLSEALQVDTSTIRRWVASDVVPGPAAMAIKLMDYLSVEDDG